MGLILFDYPLSENKVKQNRCKRSLIKSFVKRQGHRAIGGKIGKAAVLPGFCKIERGGEGGGAIGVFI